MVWLLFSDVWRRTQGKKLWLPTPGFHTQQWAKEWRRLPLLHWNDEILTPRAPGEGKLFHYKGPGSLVLKKFKPRVQDPLSKKGYTEDFYSSWESSLYNARILFQLNKLLFARLIPNVCSIWVLPCEVTYFFSWIILSFCHTTKNDWLLNVF